MRPVTVFAGDRALLDAFRRGERAALSRVYYEYVDDIATVVRYGFAIASKGVRVPGAPDEATERDLVQEVFARAFAPRARDAYDGVRPYRPYLRRIAKNLLIDRARASGQSVAIEDVEDELVVEPAEVDPEWMRQREATAAYVATLAPELQRVVELRFEQGLSQEEVATALDISRRRVRTLEAKILRGLRKALPKIDRPEIAVARMGTR
jgi:RNA polymerase sigma factor (sigma-70 family)